MDRHGVVSERRLSTGLFKILRYGVVRLFGRDLEFGFCVFGYLDDDVVRAVAVAQGDVVPEGDRPVVLLVFGEDAEARGVFVLVFQTSRNYRPFRW